MPTAVADLGGMARYSWVFSIYLLTSTTTVPLFGKLADIYGRQRIYVIGMAVFLLGSALCGAAQSFNQLILFRAVQGIGAGAVMPVSVTLIGDIFTLEERAKMQAVFSGVWGAASLIGPALGGLVTDAFSWRYVFYFAIPFGVLSAVMLTAFLQERQDRHKHKLDLIGTALLTASIALLLVAMLEGSQAWGWGSARTIGCALVALLCLLIFLRQERAAPEPTLPVDLFRNRVIAVSTIGSVVVGALLFTLTAFVPMFAQGVMGGSAADAGAPLIAMSVGWPLASTLAGRLMIRIGYRPLVVFGGAVTVLGVGMLMFARPGTPMSFIIVSMVILGLGNGFVSTPYLVAAQNAVPWHRRGITTSLGQFFRTIGGSIAVAGFGAVLNARLANRIGDDINANAALDPALRGTLSAPELQSLTLGLADGLHAVFISCTALSLVGLGITLLFPRGSAAQHAHKDVPRAEPS